MSATRFPSIDNRMKRSLPKVGVRWTINRAVFPVGVGLGVGRGRACADGAVAATAIAAIKNKWRIKRFLTFRVYQSCAELRNAASVFAEIFIPRRSCPATDRS